MNMKPLPVIQPQTAVPESGPSRTAGMKGDPDKTAALKPQIVAALTRIFDPEIPVNIHDLGLIYDIIVDEAAHVGIRMTLTAPACPAAQFLPLEVEKRVAEIPGVAGVYVDVVWDPPWDRDRMSEAARLHLGMF
jgi:FeS assembly SUF system protein